MPTEVNNYVTCPRCGHYCPRNGPHTCPPLVAETFPRGPSNEQTLLSELGEVKRESEEIYRHLEQCRIDRDSAKAERDALVVTSERLRDWLALALENTYDMGMTTDDRRKLAEAEVFLKETAP